MPVVPMKLAVPHKEYRAYREYSPKNALAVDWGGELEALYSSCLFLFPTVHIGDAAKDSLANFFVSSLYSVFRITFYSLANNRLSRRSNRKEPSHIFQGINCSMGRYVLYMIFGFRFVQLPWHWPFLRLL